jgi:hypothetical protein
MEECEREDEAKSGRVEERKKKSEMKDAIDSRAYVIK